MLQDYHKYIKKIITEYGGSASKSENEEIKKRLDQYLMPNRFLTVTDLRNDVFIPKFTRGVEKVLGFTNEEFTTEALYDIVAHYHIALAIEYAMIAYSLLLEDDINFNSEYGYWVECDFFDKSRTKKLRLKRESWLLDFVNGQPVRQIDIWKDETETQNKSPYIKWGLQTPNAQKDTQRLYVVFYNKWYKRIGISFSERKIQVLTLIKKGYSNEKIANEMGIKPSTVKGYIKKMILKVNEFVGDAKDGHIKPIDSVHKATIELIKAEKPINNRIELMNFAEKYSLMWSEKYS